MKKVMKPKNTSKRGLVGAVLAAIAASVCCVGPLILLGLGVGGAWAGNLAAMQPFRPYLVVLTLLFLGYAFFTVYRKPKAEDCEPGSRCADPKSDKINKILLWTVTVFVLVLLALPSLTPVLFAGDMTPVELNTPTREVVLDVSGMTCSSCAITLQKSLLRVNGVIEAQASFENKNAIVKYDTTKVTTGDLMEATRDAGYESTVR